MKKLLTSSFLLLSFGVCMAQQYGYDYCYGINATLVMGDSLVINLDNDTVPTAVIRTYIDQAYGRTARLVSLKPNSGSSYLRDVKFYTDGVGVNNVQRYNYNDQISHSSGNTSAGPYIFREHIANHFNPGTTGYVAYMHRWFFDPAFPPDTPEYSCTGWMKISVGSTLDTIRVSGACGCDPNGIAAGQPSSYTTSIERVPSEVMVSCNDRQVVLSSGSPNLHYSLYDAIGRKLAGERLSVGRTALDLAVYPKGFLVLCVNDDEGKTIRSIKLVY